MFNQITHVDHPHFMAFVPGPNNYVSVLADFLASGFNVFPTAWIVGAGAEQIELTTINWLKSMLGFPDSAEGLFVSGGSMANLTALTVARQVKLNNDIENTIVYFSNQTHFSVDRALKVLGFKQHQICRIETDEDLKISVSTLRKQIKEDRLKGKNHSVLLLMQGQRIAERWTPSMNWLMYVVMKIYGYTWMELMGLQQFSVKKEGSY